MYMQGERLGVRIGWRLVRMDGEETSAKDTVMRIALLRDYTTPPRPKFTLTFITERLEQTEVRRHQWIGDDVQQPINSR